MKKIKYFCKKCMREYKIPEKEYGLKITGAICPKCKRKLWRVEPACKINLQTNRKARLNENEKSNILHYIVALEGLSSFE